MNKLILIIFSVILLYKNINAETIDGKVIKIADGDTVTLLKNNKKYKIRLSSIDAPELHQEFGKNSKMAISKICNQAPAKVNVITQDQYKRYVGDLFCNYNGEWVNANEYMVKNGYAYVFYEYLKDKNIPELENYAKQNKLGVWAIKNMELPKDFRKQNRNKKH